jgi:hypothetical protein
MSAHESEWHDFGQDIVVWRVPSVRFHKFVQTLVVLSWNPLQHFNDRVETRFIFPRDESPGLPGHRR